MYDANNPVIVIANGEFPTHEVPINYLKNCNHIICTDGAADKINEFGLKPNVVIGDFDSTKISSKDRLGSWIEAPDQNDDKQQNRWADSPGGCSSIDD